MRNLFDQFGDLILSLVVGGILASTLLGALWYISGVF